MSRYLITGGLGLIGSEIAEHALAAGHHVTIVDDGRANVVPYVDGAIHYTQPIEDYAGDGPFDAVVHCAAPVGPVGILGRNVLAEMTSANEAAIEVAYQAECPLVVMSSSEVYGATIPNGENLIVPGEWSPRSEYAVGKIVTELMARRHHHETGLPTAVIRPWNVTGPRQAASKGFIFPRFAEACVRGDAPTVYLPGDQRRSYMAVGDVAHLMLGLLAGEEFWDGTPVDIATPDNACSVMDLARWFTGCHLSRAGEPVVVDPTIEHGPMFREAACGSKLPPRDPALCGWTTLDLMVGAAMRAALERVALDAAA